MKETARFRNILILKLRNIGDVLLSTPVARRLKEAYPGARVTFVVNSGTEPMVTLNPNIDEVLVFQRDWKKLPIHRAMAEQFRFIKRIRAAKFDLAINLTEGDRAAVMAWLSGAAYRIGWDPQGTGMWGKRFIFDRLVNPGPTDHIIDWNLSVLDALDIDRGSHDTELYFSDRDARRVAHLLAEGGLAPEERTIHIHPAARWFFKCWVPENVARVIDHVWDRYELRTVLTSGPDPKELEFNGRIRSASRAEPIDLSGLLSLKETAAVSCRSEFFFGVDTAPMHMAGAVGTPVAAVFGPTNEKVWGPGGARDLILSMDMDCRPCNRDGCDGSKISRCLHELSASEVIEKLDPWVERLRNKGRV